jgi:hypothetical protein
MFCSNCGAQLMPNGVCPRCGVPATNMTFNGYTQGQPVTPQQPFYNPNPMYVQYQGPQQGYGQQPYYRQENVAIRGIKDPRVVAGIGSIIKDSCGSMLMVMVSLLTTLAMIFSYIQLFYIPSESLYTDIDDITVAVLVIIFMQCIPFTLFTIGAWIVTFHGFVNYQKKLYNSNACMHTSGFSTIQAGAICALIPTVIITLIVGMTAFVILFMGAMVVVGVRYDEGYIILVIITVLLLVVFFILMIVLESSLISQMAKIKHAINGRNYESISLLLPILLFIMAVFYIFSIISTAVAGEIFMTITSSVFAIWYIFTACTLLYTRTRINNYIGS